MSNPADAIIILANGIRDDGNLPANARARVEKAAKLYKSGAAKKLVMSGQWSFVRRGLPIKTEAQAMAEFAVSLGLPEKDILKEELSKDTIGNAYFSKTTILKPRGWHNVIVVTSKAHAARAQYIFRKILGPRYQLTLETSEDIYAPKVLKRINKLERRYRLMDEILIENLKDGDDKAMKEILFSQHPAYMHGSHISYLRLAISLVRDIKVLWRR